MHQSFVGRDVWTPEVLHGQIGGKSDARKQEHERTCPRHFPLSPADPVTAHGLTAWSHACEVSAAHIHGNRTKQYVSQASPIRAHGVSGTEHVHSARQNQRRETFSHFVRSSEMDDAEAEICRAFDQREHHKMSKITSLQRDRGCGRS